MAIIGLGRETGRESDTVERPPDSDSRERVGKVETVSLTVDQNSQELDFITPTQDREYYDATFSTEVSSNTPSNKLSLKCRLEFNRGQGLSGRLYEWFITGENPYTFDPPIRISEGETIIATVFNGSQNQLDCKITLTYRGL